jgi:ataxin-3
LQHDAFDEIQLAEVAQRLDADERAALGGGYLEGQSANVRADGFFSVQVISQALRATGLVCTPIGSEDAQSASRDPKNEQAFIFNRNEHWYSIRRLGQFWWVLIIAIVSVWPTCY